jgi:hypothetical protein
LRVNRLSLRIIDRCDAFVTFTALVDAGMQRVRSIIVKPGPHLPALGCSWNNAAILAQKLSHCHPEWSHEPY